MKTKLLLILIIIIAVILCGAIPAGIDRVDRVSPVTYKPVYTTPTPESVAQGYPVIGYPPPVVTEWAYPAPVTATATVAPIIPTMPPDF